MFKYIMAQKHKLKIFSYDFHIDFVHMIMLYALCIVKDCCSSCH